MYDLIDRNQLLQWLKVSDFENYNGMIVQKWS